MQIKQEGFEMISSKAFAYKFNFIYSFWGYPRRFFLLDFVVTLEFSKNGASPLPPQRTKGPQQSSIFSSRSSACKTVSSCSLSTATSFWWSCPPMRVGCWEEGQVRRRLWVAVLVLSLYSTLSIVCYILLYYVYFYILFWHFILFIFILFY